MHVAPSLNEGVLCLQSEAHAHTLVMQRHFSYLCCIANVDVRSLHDYFIRHRVIHYYVQNEHVHRWYPRKLRYSVIPLSQFFPAYPSAQLQW